MNPPSRDGSSLSLGLALVQNGVLTRDEMLAMLEGMTLEEYRLSKTKLGKLLAGKNE